MISLSALEDFSRIATAARRFLIATGFDGTRIGAGLSMARHCVRDSSECAVLLSHILDVCGEAEVDRFSAASAY